MAESLFEFLWIYLIGPIVADALNSTTAVWNGVIAEAGYNLINTSVYVSLSLYVFYGIYRLFERYSIDFNLDTVLYTLPFILIGGMSRYLQDAGIVPYPFSIMTITPIIYIMIAAVYLGFLAVAFKFRRQNLDLTIGILGSMILTPVLILSLYSLYILQADITFIAYSLIISITLTAPFYLYIRKTDFDTLIYSLAGFSQLFEGTVSMLSVRMGAEQKQLLAQLSTDIFGSPGILILKAVLLGTAIYILKDLEDRTVEAMVLLALLAIGLGTGLRVMLRTAAGV